MSLVFAKVRDRKFSQILAKDHDEERSTSNGLSTMDESTWAT